MVRTSLLVWCPTYVEGGREMLRPESRASLERLCWEGEKEVVIARENPYSEPRLNVLHQYQRGRRYFLEGEWDYFLTFEHDMVAPEDGAIKLAEILDGRRPVAGSKPGVAYGVYLFRHGRPVLNAWRLEGRKYVGQALDFFPEQLAEARKAEVYEVSGVGFGFTMFSRWALERAPEFHPARSGHQIPDVPFSEDCLRLGIGQYAHFGVLCGHFRADGTLLWPFEGGSLMVKVKALAAVVTPSGKHLEQGREYELGEEEARELERVVFT